MFDNTCKLLVEQFKDDFVRWIFGENRGKSKLLPTELAVEAIRADSLIMLVRDNIIIHLEFQTNPDEKMPSRMANYWFRINNKYPTAEIRQIVIYLKETTSQLVLQKVFTRSGMRLEFEVIRLWEKPLSDFLELKGLLPLAVLAKSNNRANTLREISSRIDNIEDKREQSDIATATSVLAGLVLDKEIISSILREEIMQESVIYQDIKEQGRAEGRKQEASSLILRQLRKRIGAIESSESTRISELSIEKLEALGDALLDFNSHDDLMAWLAQN